MKKDIFLMITEKVNFEAIDRAKKFVPGYMDMNNVSIVRDVVEKYLICRPVSSDADIRDAITLEKNLGFDDISDWVSYTLRRITEPYLEICLNCGYYQAEDSYCPKQKYKVNPNFYSKPCFTRDKAEKEPSK